jgi:hypothetical protein
MCVTYDIYRYIYMSHTTYIDIYIYIYLCHVRHISIYICRVRHIDIYVTYDIYRYLYMCVSRTTYRYIYICVTYDIYTGIYVTYDIYRIGSLVLQMKMSFMNFRFVAVYACRSFGYSNQPVVLMFTAMRKTHSLIRISLRLSFLLANHLFYGWNTWLLPPSPRLLCFIYRLLVAFVYLLVPADRLDGSVFEISPSLYSLVILKVFNCLTFALNHSLCLDWSCNRRECLFPLIQQLFLPASSYL